MPRFDHVSDETLEKRKAAIDFELKNRALKTGGQDATEFRALHTEPNCSLSTIYIDTVGSGFWHVGFSQDENYEAPMYRYRLQCSGHGSSSAIFGEMSPIQGAVEK